LTGYQPFPLSVEELAGRLGSIRLGSRTVPSLAAEDLLLVLCAHGTVHRWGRLGWIADVARLVLIANDIDWGRVRARARALGAERRLVLGLALAQDLFGARLEERDIGAAFEDAAIRGLVAAVREALLKDAAAGENGRGDFAWAGFHLRSFERLRDRARYCLGLAFTPNTNDWQAVHLPQSLFALYRLIRPARLAWNQIRRLAKGARARDPDAE